MDEYKTTWDLLFGYHRPSPAFDIQELAITTGGDVAFAVAIMRCGPGTFSSLRRKVDFCDWRWCARVALNDWRRIGRARNSGKSQTA
jgi:hypothetical protein